MQLLRPFLRVLEEAGIAPIRSARAEPDPDERLPVSVAHQLLTNAGELTGDEDLGLKAVQRVSFGDVGALDYVVASGGTIEEALKAAARYMRLVNDALDVELDARGGRACLRLENTVVLPRAAADFQLGALFWNYFRSWLADELTSLARRSGAPARLRTDGPLPPRLSALDGLHAARVPEGSAQNRMTSPSLLTPALVKTSVSSPNLPRRITKTGPSSVRNS